MDGLNELRKQVRTLIREMAGLSESQKSPEVDDFVTHYFTKADFYIGGNMVDDELGKKELALECTNELRRLVTQAQTGELPYDNFYILKFAEFAIRTAKGLEPLSFDDPSTSEGSLFKVHNNAFLMYAYKDRIFRILPYNTKWDTDAKVENEAKRFIGSSEFEKTFSTSKEKAKFTGEVKSLWMGKKIIVYSEYFSGKKEEEPVQKEKSPIAVSKKKFRVNTPLIHKLFGKGIIKKTEVVKKEPDGDLYNLDVEFPDYGLKKIRMKASV